MPAAAVSGDQKMRSRSCFTSCFSSSAVYDPEDSPGLPPEKAAGRSPEAFFWARASRQSKTVPLVEEITADEVGYVAEGREIKREVPPSVISPAALCDEGMPGTLRKAERRCKFTGAKPLTQKPLSTCSNKRSNNQHANKNHHLSSTNHKLNHRGPVQSRTRTKMVNKNSPNSTRSAICSTTACPRLDMQIGLKLVAMMLVTILIGGKIFAVFITTLCFYFLSCRPITTNIVNDVYLKNYEKVR